MGGQTTKELYSVKIGEKTPGESQIFRHPSVGNDDLPTGLTEGNLTLQDIFDRTYKNEPDRPFLGTRDKHGKYQQKTQGEVGKISNFIQSGLVNLDLIPPIYQKEYDIDMKFIALYSKNREEWVLAEQACHMQAVTIVTLYDSYGPDTAKYILHQADIPTVICSESKTHDALQCTEYCLNLKNIIQFEGVTDKLKEEGLKVGVRIFSLDEVIEAGKENIRDHVKPKLQDVTTFCQTSGTTGNPKGVMLTHGNFSAEMSLSLDVLTNNQQFDHTQYCSISQLPLAHMFERMMLGICIYYAGRYGFYSGEVKLLMDDIKTLQPTVLPIVPRLLTRVQDTVLAKVPETGIKSWLFYKALDAKIYNLEVQGYPFHWLYDRLVFKKTKQALGGKIQAMITGSAPIDKDVLQKLKAFFQCNIIEGYGQTESCAGATVTHFDTKFTGHVGGPIPCNEIKLVDVPEMNQTSDRTDKEGNSTPAGEICFRGANIMKGYQKEKEKTDEAIDKNGWLHSGDIGIFNVDGSLKIVDRIKNIFKLQQGEQIAPEKVENIIVQSVQVAQAFLFGNSYQSQTVLIIVPDELNAKKYAEENNLELDISSSDNEFSDICNDDNFKKAVWADVVKVCKENKCNSLEIPKQMHIHDDLFTADNGLLTPTFKLKRFECGKQFKDVITELQSRKI